MDPTPPTVQPGFATGADVRVAQRFPAGGLELRWSPPTSSVFGRRNRSVAVEVLDISVAGALLVAPANPCVHRGLTVAISHGKLRGTVRVRHMRQAATPGRQCYGVLFLHLDPGLQELFFRPISQARGELVRRWSAPVESP